MAEISGAEMIAAERARQRRVEGWTAEHDDQYRNGELSVAAACYVLIASALARWEPGAVDLSVPPNWPWDGKWWKPAQTPLRNLIKAGALIAAEIDRVLREQEKGNA
jgi:hypothetical protein